VLKPGAFPKTETFPRLQLEISFHLNSKIASASGGFDSFKSRMSSLNLDSVESRVLPVKSRQTVLRVLEDSEGETRDQPFCRLRRIVRCEVRTDQSEHLITGIRVVPLRIERFRREGHGHGDGDHQASSNFGLRLLIFRKVPSGADVVTKATKGRRMKEES